MGDQSEATETAVLQRADENLAAYLRHLALTVDGGAVAGGITETDGYLLFAGGHDYPGTYTNGALRLSSVVSPWELFARAEEFFGRLGRSYMLWARAHADAELESEAVRRSLWLRPPEAGNPLIARPVAADQPPPSIDGIQLERVTTAGQRADYLQLVARSYDVGSADAGLLDTILFSRRSLESEQVIAYLATEGGRPLAAAGGFRHEATIGMYWIATEPDARGRGLAKAASSAVLSDAVATGAELAVAQASQLGTPMWLSLGFTIHSHYRRYLAPPPVAASAAAGSTGSARRPMRRRSTPDG